MLKFMKKIFLFFNFIILFTISSFSQRSINLNEMLTTETVKKWDEYITKYAPSDSAFNVVFAWAQRHFQLQRAAVAKYIFEKYRDLFPNYKSMFDTQIRNCEQVMLSQSPTDDMRFIYHNYIFHNAPSDNAFVAVQRLLDKYIKKRDWDSALTIIDTYKVLFPNTKYKFEKLAEIINRPLEGITVRNLGNNVNTNRSEWDPTLSPDGKYLYFSADHRSGGYGKSDIWYCEMEDGKWSKPKNLGPSINKNRDETIDNISLDGTILMLSGDFEGSYGKFDIYFAEKDSLGFTNLIHLGSPINTQYHEESACLSPDSKHLLFTSDRPGGVGPYVPINTVYYNGSTMGNMDIYISFLTDSGWSEPINLGPTINTPYAERAVFLHPDGKTIYFSSNGHPGLGRLDVFKSTRLDDTWLNWSEPINLGKEINTEDDDWGYIVSMSGDSALFAKLDASDGYGGWDIYSVNLPKSAKPEKVITIRGKVKTSDGKPLSALIKWENLEDGENLGFVKSDPKDGSYILTLTHGKLYGYFCEKKGYYPASNFLDLRNKIFNDNIVEDIILYSVKEIKEDKVKIVINNIFFDYNKSEIRKESIPELNRLVDFLNNNKKEKVLIAGHTDDIGGKEFNQKLSEERANSVKEFLISKGIYSDRIKTIGYGDTRPLVPNKDENSRAKNRRVEFSFE
jgi:outer membrane protein OmpA-like peptidoglycan-associated protein/Tol biopolymer transport system component